MRLLALFVCLFITAESLHSQAYQRMFRHGDRDNTTLDAFHTDNRNTYVLSIFQDTLAGLQGINLTRHDEKGSNRWSRDYYVTDTISVEPFGEIISLPDEETIVMTVRTRDNGAYGQIVLHTNNMGELNYSGAIGGVQLDTTEVNRVELFESPYGGYLTATQDSIDSLSSVLINYLDVGGSLIWNQSYSSMDTLGNAFQSSFSDMVVEPDSNILIVGSFRDTFGFDTTNVVNDGFYLARFDTLGVPTWSQEYTIASSTEIVPLDMEILADSSIMVVGARVLNSFQGFACRISKDGNVIWNRNIRAFNIPSPFENIHINEVTQGVNGNLVVSGIVSKLNPFVQGVVNIELSIDDGSIVWSKVYDREIVFNTNSNYLGMGGLDYTPLKYNNQGNLLSSADNGYMVVNSMYDGPGFQTPQASPLLIKTDDVGGALCENDIELNLDSLTISVDTLVWTARDGAFLQGLNVEDVPYFGISAPILGIEEVVVCPNLPIDTFLDGTQVNAIKYEWATGDTTAILNVMEEGDYPVTVTFDTEVCFTLCDTAKVSTYDVLTSEVDNVNWDLWCSDRLFRLDGQGIDGQDPYTYQWNTGDTTQVILMPEDSIEMNFIVTVTDQCGMTSETAIYIGYDHPGIPEPDVATITFREDLYCLSPEDNRAYILEVSVNETTPAFDQSTIRWSTGSADDGMLSISVDGPGMYSVTLVDNCQYEITDDIDFDVPGPETIELEVIEDECYEQIQLNFESGTININSIQWSTGPMDNGQTVIDVEDYSVPYSVTVVDNCNYTLTDEIMLDPNLEPTPVEVSLSQEASACGASISINVDADDIDPNTIIWTPDIGCNGSLDCTFDGDLPATVFVNLTDQCGFNITESIDVNPDFMAVPDVISYNLEQFVCGNDGSGVPGALITLTGPAGYDQSTITWSIDATAAGQDSLYVSLGQPSIVTVNLVDQCEFVISETIEFEFEQLDPAMIELVLDSVGFCDNGFINVSAELSGDVDESSISWIPSLIGGEGTSVDIAMDSILYDTLGNLIITAQVLDICGNPVSDNILVNRLDSFPPCGSCLRWPNIFFPSRQGSIVGDTTDFFFQPVSLDCNLNLLEGYELYVYNGYGNLVFESTDPTAGWNGRKDDDEQPSGVYMYYAKWSFNQVEYESKGDVSLMR